MELWVLAGRILLPKLQNHVIDVLTALSNDCPGFSILSEALLQYVYDKTTPEEPLRRLFVEQAMGGGLLHDDVGERDYYSSFPSDMLVEFALLLRARTYGSRPMLFGSNYHVEEIEDNTEERKSRGKHF